ncbi:vesicular inhibitory amino acid transporter-like, partial [Pocillopora damicornis]|uniref:vesicular inhibitory amino acid transporter-like n=1 Tax=Pocillopora damicornis TaxID=46731 RepID=UPI000F55781A
MSETTGYRLLKNHTEEGEEEREGKEHEKKILIQEEDAAGQNEESAERSSLWKAVANLMSSIEGTGLLALPYVIAESGLVAIAALVVVPFITYYTGAILIECLYETNNEGERIRVRSNYKELGKACWPRFGGAIVAAVQLIELFMLASLYLVLCASLSSSIFPGIPVSDKIWMVIAATIGFPTIFVKNISQAAWFSLVSVVALSVAVIAVLAFGIAHGSKWNLNLILVRNIDEAPVSLALIIFSFICHPILPGVEESLQNRSQFRKMLALSYTFVAILKIVFSVCAFLSFSPDIPEVIANSLPMGFLRVFVNG